MTSIHTEWTSPTMDVREAAQIIGVSGSSLYAAIRRGEAPVRTIRVLGRIKVVTQSVLDLIEGRPSA